MRDRIDRATERNDQAKAQLFRPDGSKVYGDEEHKEREAALRREFKAAMDAIESDVDRQIASTEETLLVVENADPTDALSTAELERAGAKRDFVADECWSLSLDKLTGRCKAVLASDDRVNMFLYAHHAGQRVGARGEAFSGYMDRKYGDGDSLVGSGSEESGAQAVREAVAALKSKLDPEGEKRRESARKAVEEARGLKNYSYLRRRGAKNAGELYMKQKYGNVGDRLARR